MKSSTINQKILKSSKKTVQPVNHIMLLIDTSGSMKPHVDKLNNYVNNQLRVINEVSNENNQKTVIYAKAFSCQSFGLNKTDNPTINLNIHTSSKIFATSNENLIWGNTPLRQAIYCANLELNKYMAPQDTAMLLVVTDGLENASAISDFDLQKSILGSKAFDRITYAAAGPDAAMSFFISGHLAAIFSDNFTAWETTDEGFKHIDTVTTKAVSNYYGGVSRGLTKMSKVFLDMTSVTKKDLKSLRSIPNVFKTWKVDSEARIDDFINEKLTMPTNARIFGSLYLTGNAFYQLSKPEKVQEGKLLIIKDKTTNNYYYGSSDVREVLGLPTNAPVKIEPQNLSNFEIYVQSTSLNRKLVRGTNVIYVKN
jgi:hypothetical protein